MLADTQHFIDIARSHANFFDPNAEVIVTRAPGRLDVMGGVADYSGSLVLQLPIADATHVAIQKSPTPSVRALSFGMTSSDDRSTEIDLAEFMSNNQPIEYSQARARFAQPDIHWAAYVTGVFLVLMHEKQVRFDHGARILIKSNVPEGKGVSSSAAVEVAVMQAVATAFDIDLQPQELATLCQKTENLVAGAPCGIMDQMTSACGEADRLLELLCQPATLRGTVKLPDELEVWGIDSGVRHSVGGSDYGTVRTAAFMGYRMIADVAGLSISDSSSEGMVHVEDPKWHGYLANIRPEEFETSYASQLPATLLGSEFLNRYRGTTDHVTRVCAGVYYPVLDATRHPIYENARVKEWASVLQKWQGQEGPRLGELMFQSHQSYSDCGLGSEATDLIVRLVRDLSNGELFGARITGGGSGGTVAVLGKRGARDRIEQVRKQFAASTGYLPLIISGSSPGAGVFGHLTIDRLG